MKNINLPPYDAYPSISNNRVTLRAVKDIDLKWLMDISYYDGIQASSIEQAQIMNNQINEDYSLGKSIHWVIEDNLSKCIVGTCGYYRGFGNNAGELGCILLPNFRGEGFMFNALSLAISFGFKTIGFSQIWALTNATNSKAIKLLKNLNFKRIEFINDSEVKFELNSPFN